MTNEEAVPTQEVEGESPAQQEEIQEESQLETEQPQDQTEDSQPQEDELELPADAKEKTKERFDKLRNRLNETEEKLERKSVFDEFKLENPNLPQVPQGVDLNQFVQEDGTVDITGMNNAVNQAIQTGQMGYQQAQRAQEYMQKMDQRIQEAEAYQAHENLNPNADTFDEEFRDLVADRLVRNYIQTQKTGAEPMTLREAADQVSKVYRTTTPKKEVKEAVEKYKQSREARDQGPISQGRGAPEEEADIEKLRDISRRGSREDQQAAMIARLKKAGL